LKSIAIVLLGEVEHLYSLLKDTIEAAINFYFEDTKITIERCTIPQESFNEIRKQYNAELLLSFLNRQNLSQKYDIVIGLIDHDIYYRDLRYVFGLAAVKSKKIIISTFRLKHDVSLTKTAQFEVFKERIFKELLHELGHIIGLQHCKNRTCVMNFSPTLTEVDEKLPMLCDECLKKVESFRGK